MYPTEYVKTQLQLGKAYRGPLDCAKAIIQDKGFFSLYRGMTTLIVGSIPKAGVRFAAFQQLSTLMKDEQGKLSAASTMLCGLGAGALEALVAVTPMETVKTKMIHDQNSAHPKYKGLVHGVSTILRAEGIRGIYQGVLPTVLKQSGNQMVRFSVYNQAKAFFQGGDHKKDLLPWQSIFSGALAGFVSVYVTMPVDVVKTRMQGLEASKYGTTWNCFKHILLNDGILAFWQGTVPRLSRVMFSGAIIFTCYEQFMQVLNNLVPEDK
jgi:solute carrier family 25 citrate transporter 1